MQTTPTTEPAEITAGDSVTWLISLSDYPASAGWSLKYRLLSSAGKIDITAAASGDSHLVTIPPATSATYPAGDYQAQKYVEKGTGSTLERHTLDTGRITVAAGLFAATAATDTRSQVKRTLDAIDAVLEGRAARSDLNYEISTGATSRRLQAIPHEDLLKLRSVYATRYWREMNPGRIAPAVNVSFGGRY